MPENAIVILSEREQLTNEIIEISHDFRKNYQISSIPNEDDLLKMKMSSIQTLIIDKTFSHPEIIQILKKLNERNPKYRFPVMMIQTAFDKDQILEAAKQGVNQYLVYPYQTGSLKSKLIHLLSHEILSEHYVTEIIRQEKEPVRSHETIRSVMKKMVLSRSSGMVVTEENRKIIGYISEKDLLSYISILMTEAENVLISQVMVKNIKSLPMNTNIDEALKFMLKNNLKQIPIVNLQNQYTGMITRFDLLQFILNQHLRI